MILYGFLKWTKILFSDTKWPILEFWIKILRTDIIQAVSAEIYPVQFMLGIPALCKQLELFKFYAWKSYIDECIPERSQWKVIKKCSRQICSFFFYEDDFE